MKLTKDHIRYTTELREKMIRRLTVIGLVATASLALLLAGLLASTPEVTASKIPLASPGSFGIEENSEVVSKKYTPVREERTAESNAAVVADRAINDVQTLGYTSFVTAKTPGSSASTRTATTSKSTKTKESGAQNIAFPVIWYVKTPGWVRKIKPGGQAQIDRCQEATLWDGSIPGNGRTYWLAGHNHCGFWHWSDLGIDDTVLVYNNQGTKQIYKVYQKKYIPRQGGSSEGLVEGDLMLQTCKGSGTILVYAKLIH